MSDNVRCCETTARRNLLRPPRLLPKLEFALGRFQAYVLIDQAGLLEFEDEDSVQALAARRT